MSDVEPAPRLALRLARRWQAGLLAFAATVAGGLIMIAGLQTWGPLTILVTLPLVSFLRGQALLRLRRRDCAHSYWASDDRWIYFRSNCPDRRCEACDRAR